jgi:hypothetical protein
MFRPNPWIFALVGLSLAMSWYFAAQGPVRATPRAECLTDANCQSGERCVIIPKGDGFATLGQCGEACVDDTSCANGWTCRAWVDDTQYLSPDRGRAAELPRVKVCQHHSVQ